jgi:hypothetical protein
VRRYGSRLSGAEKQPLLMNRENATNVTAYYQYGEA